jgi:hypothetical protein
MQNEDLPPYGPACTDIQTFSPNTRYHVSRPIPQEPFLLYGRSKMTGDSSTSQKSSLDFTQRLERKLAEYNESHNAFKRWIFEILSWITSAICMSSIVVIYIWAKDKPTSQAGSFLTYTNVLGKVASAALIVPTSEALGQLKWNWFQKSNAMWDFEIFDKASR